MSDIQARDYQERAFSMIYEAFLKGYYKVLLWLATGGGKTYVFCTIAKRTIAKPRKDGKPKRVAIIVRGRKLVDQASKRLFREGVAHGVYMANHWNFKPQANVQVASIDTLRARNVVLEDLDLLILDEAHLFVSEGDKEYLSRYKKVFMLNVTATPYAKGGLRHLADIMVKPTSMRELIDAGHLAPFKYYAPSEPDLSEVKTDKKSGDYVNEQLEEAMVKGSLTGEIIDNWIRIANGGSTLLFAVNIRHSKMLAARFREAGITAEHCDADTPDSEREEIIKRLESGETTVVCNVGLFCTGIDIPSLRWVVMARPTQSLNLYIQQAGRLTRLFSGKLFGGLIDHAGNIKKHGLPTDEPDVDLDGHINDSYVSKSRTCKLCRAIFVGVHCPECGPQEKPDTVVEFAETKAELTELVIEVDPVLRAFKDLLKEAKKGNRKPSWASYKLIDRFGLDKARPHLTEAFIQRYETKTSANFSSSRFKPITFMKVEE